MQKIQSPCLPHRFLFLLLGMVILVGITSCSPSEPKVPQMWANGKEDPVRKRFGVPTQYFSLSGERDTLILGAQGTLFLIPKGSLVLPNGEIPAENIQLQVVETYSQSDFITSGLDASSEGKLLESGGMVFINATASNSQLTINKKLPLTIEFPAFPFKSGMQAFSGAYDANGKIEWSDPVSPEKWLIPVPLKHLLFYADKKMPFQASNDSPSNIFRFAQFDGGTGTEIADSIRPKPCGLNQDIVNVLYEPQFENTLVSTREFELRMNQIHRTCDEKVLKLYLDNLDLNLWEIDQLASDYLAELDHPLAKRFYDFSEMKQTKVKASREGDLLTSFLADEYASIDQKRKADQDRYLAASKKRLLSNVFEFSELGWINVDRFVNKPNTQEIALSVQVTGAPDLSNCKVSMVFSSISSVYFLEQDENGGFYCGSKYKGKRTMALPYGEEVTLVATAWGDDSPLLGKKLIRIGSDDRVVMPLNSYSDEDFLAQLSDFNVRVNLPDSSTVAKSWGSFNCCSESFFLGQWLFQTNCKSCHSERLHMDLTGPALWGVRDRVPNEQWLIDFTRNSSQVIASGDAYATTLYAKWNKTQMTAMPHLTDHDIKSIYAYIDAASGGQLFSP